MQAHGSKVYYRNIYVKELKNKNRSNYRRKRKKRASRFCLTERICMSGLETRLIISWKMAVSLWSQVVSGGNLYTKKEYGNFIYRFDFQLTPGATNGVGISYADGRRCSICRYGSRSWIVNIPIYQGNITRCNITVPYTVSFPPVRIIRKRSSRLENGIRKRSWRDGGSYPCDGEWSSNLDGNIRDAVKNGTPDGKEHPGLFNKKVI